MRQRAMHFLASLLLSLTTIGATCIPNAEDPKNKEIVRTCSAKGSPVDVCICFVQYKCQEPENQTNPDCNDPEDYCKKRYK